MRKRNVGQYIVGSLVLTIGAAVLMPKAIDLLAAKLYEHAPRGNIDTDDWEPEIVCRKNSKRED